MFSTTLSTPLGRRLLMPGLAFAAALLCLAVCQSSRAGQVDLSNAHLSDLLVPGNFAIVGNKRFDTFGFTTVPSGGALVPDPADIKVSAITSNGDTGLSFQGGPFLALDGQMLDAHLTFDVTALDPMKKITMAELIFTAATTGGGSASISEVVRDAMNQQLGQQLVIEQQNLPNGGQSFMTMNFAPQTTVQVSKDILLVGTAFTTTSEINVAQMSDFSQVFDSPRVPEPSGIVMAAIGSGGIGWFGWRRKKAQKRGRIHN